MTRKFVVMGVAGCGKTSIGNMLARHMNAVFIDGDDLHPPANIAKMSRGEPLDDSDRAPWLARVSATLAESDGVTLIGCSALRKIYRHWIREGVSEPVMFIHLAGSRDVIAERMGEREGHFMPTSLLDSQFETLEPPEDDELSLTVDIDRSQEDVVEAILADPLMRQQTS
ncbi:gluconokinase [Amaricoccus tamworthensis]|uniref:gluconokinase n=1 Tax=Amaricoccus tamworthensis TaxID=57002 RepID=UPI003C7B6A10